MNKKIGFLLLLLVVVLSGCTTSRVVEPVSPARPVVLGMHGIPQPDWVYKSVTSSDRHYESGYGKMSNQQNSIKRATVEAKNKIAAWLSTQVKEVIVTYVNDAGSGDDRQALDVMEAISLQIAEATLSGVTTEEMWVDAEGGVWVLCTIALADVEQNFSPAADAVAQAYSENDASDAAIKKMKDGFARLLRSPV
ncbi:MAG: hypothetical protein EOM32_13800 [Spirochaetia bacterium]|nr:hypothetical protein [Spirochaetia bacterium]